MGPVVASLEAEALVPVVTSSSLSVVCRREVSSSLHISLLGGFRVWRDHLPIESAGWKTQKVKTLLKILLTEQRRLVLQDRILEYLWPRHPYKGALNSLWVCVNQLRRTLEPNLRKPSESRFILSRDNGYLFNGAGLCTLDIDELLVFLNQGDAHRAKGELELAITYYENAKNLYAGDYLEEDLYADWAITRRLELQQAHCHLLKSLAECWAALGQYPKALSYYQKILAKEGCRESIWREVMRCYWHLGERDQALLAFEQCKEILRKELKVQPLLPTIELQAKIAQGVIPSSS